MTILKNLKRYVERDSRSPVYSHQADYSDQVHAICHHSGRYLTYRETNPTVRLLLREQHDFPGLPKLDQAFNKAAHSHQHEHWIWSQPGIRGLVMILSGIAVFMLAYYTNELRDFVPADIWWWLFLVVVITAFVGSLAFVGYGLMLIGQREEKFHQWAQGMPPATPDFPIECNYEIEIEENLTAQLGNMVTYPENVVEQNGRVTAIIVPVQNDLEMFAQYREQYRMHPVGNQVMAGAIALRGLEGINLVGSSVDFDHRIILRDSSAKLKLDQSGETYESFSITTDYTISPSILYTEHKGLKQFPLQCEPIISRDDSRTLELRFTWRPTDSGWQMKNLKIALEECVLESISDDYLKPATFVKHGRYDQESEHVIWRNMHFREVKKGEWQLRLFVTFEYPILNCPEYIVGKYKLKMNGLVSNLQVSSDYVWTAWGLRAGENDCVIRKGAIIQGELRINPQLLSQEHEHVTDTEPIICPLPPDVYLIGKVLKVIQDEGFELQRVLQASPRLHPTGRLDASLQYWDVAGRRYNPETLDAIDIHIVISGYEHSSRLSTKEKIRPRSQIDIRLRCLHDPRNKRTPEQADILIGEHVEDGQMEQQYTLPEMPIHLYNHLQQILVNCDPFNNDRTLRNIFADGRINEWQEHLPKADTIADRVDMTVSTLYSRRGADGQNALVSLLEVLQERISSEDRHHHHLSRLADELRQLTANTDGAAPEILTFMTQNSEMLGLVNRIKQALDCETGETINS